MNTKPLLLMAALFLSLGSAQASGDAASGKSLSGHCAACHGPNGISANPVWPNLAGQKAGYLEKQLRAFRSGERKDPMMSAQASALTDKDIADLSAYFSSLK